MATTTTNFGWDIPQSTDLVKDGATAIAALGQDIDTALVDLKGGTTGQVLSKASGTDLDFTWVAQDDSNAIQNAIVDAKGDLISATAADTPARLAVGTDGQVLTADSTTATGLKWATAASGSTFAGCSLYNSGNWTISAGTVTSLGFDSETFDVGGYHSTSTNTSRITIPTGKAGYYHVVMNAIWGADFSEPHQMRLLKNGSLIWLNTIATPGSAMSLGRSQSQIVYGAEADYFEFAVYQDSASSKTLTGGSGIYSSFQIAYLGA